MEEEKQYPKRKGRKRKKCRDRLDLNMFLEQVQRG